MPALAPVVAPTNWWAWAALVAGLMPFVLLPLLMIGIADQQVAGEPIASSDALAVSALGLPGVLLSVVGILVAFTREQVGVWIALTGGVAALAFPAVMLLLMYG